MSLRVRGGAPMEFGGGGGSEEEEGGVHVRRKHRMRGQFAPGSPMTLAAGVGLGAVAVFAVFMGLRVMRVMDRSVLPRLSASVPWVADETAAHAQQAKETARAYAASVPLRFHGAACALPAFSIQDLTLPPQPHPQAVDHVWYNTLPDQRRGQSVPAGARSKWFNQGKQVANTMMHHTELETGSRALVLGCGVGRVAFGLASWGWERVLCVDADSDALLVGVLESNARGGVGAGAVSFLVSGPPLVHRVRGAGREAEASDAFEFVCAAEDALAHMRGPAVVAALHQMCTLLGGGGRGYAEVAISGPDGKEGGNPVRADSGTRTDDDECDTNAARSPEKLFPVPLSQVQDALQQAGCQIHKNIPLPNYKVVGAAAIIFVKE